MPSNPARRAASGFTLIEMLVVVLILGIVAAVGLPGFREAMSRNRLVSQHNELLASFSLARSEAIRRNTTVALCAANDAQTACQSTWGRNWLVWVDADADGTVDAGEEVLQVGGVSATETLASPTSHTVFRFSARGLRVAPAAGTTATLRIRANNCAAGNTTLARTITVLSTGATTSQPFTCT